MHWFSLFLKHLGNNRKIQIFQTHCQSICVKKKKDKSLHTFAFKRYSDTIRNSRIKVNPLNVTENISLELKNMNFH